STRTVTTNLPERTTPMSIKSRYLAGVATLLLLGSAPSAGAETLAGPWAATLTVRGTVSPFRLELSEDRPGFQGTLLNGDETQTTTFASHEGKKIVLRLDHYLTSIVAEEDNGVLVGQVQQRGDGDEEGSAFRAVRYVPPAPVTGAVPDISGHWIIPH